MRDLDLVLFGATGFTGRLVASYLLEKREPVKFALAGRDRAKLEALRKELGADVPIEVADVGDPASMDALARRSRVVCTTVGPYAKYGSPLVAACARAGTHYCDLTGEPHWIRKMIDAHHTEALASGARIVHCCGFDSIPSDLGVHVVQEHALREHGAPCEAVTYALTKGKGGVSGGTIASMLNLLDEAQRDRAVRRVLADPYGLNPEGERSGPDGRDTRGVGYRADLGAWTAPFVMAAINTRIVRRSNALLGFRYGRNFRYDEVSAFPKGPRGWAMAVGMTAGLGGFMAAAGVKPTRKWLESSVLPKPGEGPDREARERGYFEVRLVGRGLRDGQPFAVQGNVAGKGDPGYAATARMLGESALCLARDPLESPAGISTPAVAMGTVLVERLRAAGMRFDAETVRPSA